MYLYRETPALRLFPGSEIHTFSLIRINIVITIREDTSLGHSVSLTLSDDYYYKPIHKSVEVFHTVLVT